MHVKCRFGLIGAFSKTTLFLCFHKHQIANGNWIFQGNPLARIWLLPTQLCLIHSNRFDCRKLEKIWGVPNFFQNVSAKEQSLKRWMMDSSWQWQMGHVVWQVMPLSARVFRTGILLWKQSQMKCWIFGKVSIFHNQPPEKAMQLVPSSRARAYTEAALNSPFCESFHTRVSSFSPNICIGTARIFSNTSFGKTKESFSQHHLPSWNTFATVNSESDCVSGPSISLLSNYFPKREALIWCQQSNQPLFQKQGSPPWWQTIQRSKEAFQDLWNFFLSVSNIYSE